MYTVFTRTWWRENPSWPNGLEPCPGEKEILEEGVETEAKAREVCREWNDTHEEGRLSLKAEYERE